MKFVRQETTLTCDSIEAILSGKTFAGDLILGTDTLQTGAGGEDEESDEREKEDGEYNGSGKGIGRGRNR